MKNPTVPPSMNLLWNNEGCTKWGDHHCLLWTHERLAVHLEYGTTKVVKALDDGSRPLGDQPQHASLPVYTMDKGIM